jgi:hypothetical protein
VRTKGEVIFNVDDYGCCAATSTDNDFGRSGGDGIEMTARPLTLGIFIQGLSLGSLSIYHGIFMNFTVVSID